MGSLSDDGEISDIVSDCEYSTSESEDGDDVANHKHVENLETIITLMDEKCLKYKKDDENFEKDDDFENLEQIRLQTDSDLKTKNTLRILTKEISDREQLKKEMLVERL